VAVANYHYVRLCSSVFCLVDYSCPASVHYADVCSSGRREVIKLAKQVTSSQAKIASVIRKVI